MPIDFDFWCSPLAILTGFVSAYYWLLSAKVSVAPTWYVEPAIPELSQMGWTAALLEASSRAARLNKIAARWTAASVFLQAAPKVPVLLNFLH